MALLRGWRRVSESGRQGSGRRGRPVERFISPDGREVSRRAYDNARARAAGFKNMSEYERIAASPKFRNFARRYRDNKHPDRRIDAVTGVGSRFTRMYVKGPLRAPRGRSPRGPMARFLVFIGQREPNAQYPVGGTP